jgi:hypothetical protein
MATQDVDRLMDDLRVLFPGAVDDTLKREIYNAMHWFLPHSLAWVSEATIELITGQQLYTVSIPRGRIELLLSVVDENDNASRGWMMQSITTIRCPTVPNVDGAVFTAKFATGVRLPVTREGYPDVPNEVIERWYDAILSGTSALLQRQTMKPWTNLPMAKINWGYFVKGAAEAKQRASQMSTMGAAPWRFPQQYRV